MRHASMFLRAPPLATISSIQILPLCRHAARLLRRFFTLMFAALRCRRCRAKKCRPERYRRFIEICLYAAFSLFRDTIFHVFQTPPLIFTPVIFRCSPDEPPLPIHILCLFYHIITPRPPFPLRYLMMLVTSRTIAHFAASCPPRLLLFLHMPSIDFARRSRHVLH